MKRASTRKIAGTAADPTLPKTPVNIGGTTYDLCFDFGALAEAETAINAELDRAKSEERVNLLNALPTQNLANTRLLFAAGIRTFHPEISFRDALRMPTPAVLFDVAMAVRAAWIKSSPPDGESSDPQQPGE
jgi:hypothetical protein